jgi:pyridoxal phosphate enzyme (YggS family)
VRWQEVYFDANRARLVENFQALKSRMNDVCKQVGRDPEEVSLVVASKYATPEQLKALIPYGLNDIGENRAADLIIKKNAVDENIRWHFIGHLQKNKTKKVVGNAWLIHSLDSVELAAEIDRRAGEMGKVQDALLQVNISKEESKFGFGEEEVMEALLQVTGLKNVNITGLMTIAPFIKDYEIIRQIFKRLSAIKEELNIMGFSNIKHLSMGMSNDYEIAIEEGATMIRIGSAIFS